MKTPKTFPELLTISIMISVILFTIWPVSYANDDITISGHVYDSEETPISGIYVVPFEVTGSDCVTDLDGDWTDANGFYSLTVSSGPNYRIYAGSPIDTCLPYIGEFYTDEGGTLICEDATQINTTQTIDFYLESGFIISGKVTAANGGAGIQDVYIHFSNVSACEGPIYPGHNTDSNGDYCFTVSNDTYYLHADPSHFYPQDYSPEWYNGALSCAEASAVIVSGSNVPDINFSLENGGSISGVVRDSNGVVENVEVRLWGDYGVYGGGTVTTDSNGYFLFSGLNPEAWDLSITPDVDTGLVHFNRKYWLDLGEDKNLGTIFLKDGALIIGTIKDNDGNTLSDLEYWYGSKFEIGEGNTAGDGTFAFRLPLGTYTLNIEDDSEYTMMSKEIEVTNVSATYDQGDLTAYDSNSGAVISGNIVDNATHNGEFFVVATLNNYQLTPENWGGYGILGFTVPSSGSYSLFVPPGNTIDVILSLYSENEYGQESSTFVDNILGISSFPATGKDLSYTSTGYTVDGYVKHGGEGIFNANVLLYKQPDDLCMGFAETDPTGKYIFYNVPSGTYRVAVTDQGYPDDVEWSDNFDLNENVTVPDIFMNKKGMPWLPLLLDD